MTTSIRIAIHACIFLWLFSPLHSVSLLAAESATDSSPELVRIGQGVYQKGVLANGTPVRAFVLGDVEVSGTDFTCIGCHRRSGLGGAEGSKFVLATNGAALLSPRVNLYLERPAYTLDSFAKAITEGVNPMGRTFDPIMPKYALPKLETRALFAYLQTLSNRYSPGVEAEAIHIATVVSTDADPQQRMEMLTILYTYFKNKDAQTRNEIGRLKTGQSYRDSHDKAYRRWVHHTWELTGPPKSWRAQLEAYYQKQPVFAMVSGLVMGSWAPIHLFCHDHELPCLLPNTDLPVITDPPDFYTLYYSKGVVLEAQVLNVALAEQPGVNRIIQVSRPDQSGSQGRESLAEFLKTQKISSLNLDLPTAPADWQTLRQLLGKEHLDALVLWLDAADLQRFIAETQPGAQQTPIYLSSSLLDGNLEAIPQTLRLASQIVHPFVLPEDQHKRFFQTASLLKNNQIPLTNRRIQGQTFYACLLLNAGLKHIKRSFYREYMLDMLDHSDNMAIYSGTYPRLSFGPEQRFLAKGAFLIDLGTNRSRWIVPGHLKRPD